jgi:hypothetical protein
MSDKTTAAFTLEKAINTSYQSLALHLNEYSRRIWSATEAKRYGRGGISAVRRATGIDYKTIRRGIKELESEQKVVTEKIRASGGGRKRMIDKDPAIALELDKLIEPSTRGDPESLLLWTSKSTYKLAEALSAAGHKVSQTSVHKMLMARGYSLQSNRKKLEGNQHPDRDAQFTHINDHAKQFQINACPVLSIDTKKKENIDTVLSVNNFFIIFCLKSSIYTVFIFSLKGVSFLSTP